MRESIGGAFLIKLMVIFIVLYNSLLAIAVNYAMVFRVKNEIINLLEQYEGCKGAKDAIQKYIAKVGYYRAATPTQGPYNIEPMQVANRGTYYRVTTYIKFDFPWIGDTFRVNVTGETKVIYGVFENNAQCSGI